MELHRTEVDGVPTVWTPASGPVLRAGLVFRVGHADESLPRAGVTHLIEHLVLHRVRADLHVNGATSPRTTTFYVQGDGEEVADFLGTVCAGLRDLPLDRVELEKAVLRTEAARRDGSASRQLRCWRYGPAGYGLSAFDELGLHELSDEDLRAWVAARFTRGNAALWVSGGPPPVGLRLDLADGQRLPLPVATDVLPRLPAYFTGDTNGIGFDAIVPRSSASSLYAMVLDRRLHATLRRELGLSYAAGATYEPRDAESATVTAVADALPDRHAELCRAFVAILIDLARTAPDAEEFSGVLAQARRSLFDPDGAVATVAAAAEEILTGLPVRDPHESWERLRAVNPDEVVAVGRQVLATGLALVPHGQAIGRAGFVAAPRGSAASVDGWPYKPLHLPETARRRLVVGDHGVSLTEGLEIATVRYDECVAMLAWPDGGRTLYAPDAVTVRLEPTLWDAPADLWAAVDAAVPADRVVHLPARDAADIPQPPAKPAVPPPSATAPARPAKRRQTRRRAWWPLALIATSGASMVLLLALGVPQAGVAVFVVTTTAVRVAAYVARRPRR